MNRRLCVPHPGSLQGPCYASCGFSSDSSVMPTPHPSLGLSFPRCPEWGSRAQSEWSRAGASVNPTPHVDSWAQGRLAAVLARARWGALPTCQATGSRPALHTWRGTHPY